jgi:hypothetical protein
LCSSQRLSFEHTLLVASNLGGIGGRCTPTTYDVNGVTMSVAWDQLCEEPEPGTCGSGASNAGSCPAWTSAQANSYASMADVRAADGSIITYGNEHILSSSATWAT